MLKKNILNYLSQIQNLFLIFYNVMTLVNFVIVIKIEKISLKQIFQNQSFIDLRQFGIDYQNLEILQGMKLNFIIIIFFILFISKIFKKYMIQIQSLMILKNIIYIILLMPLILGLVFFHHYTLGFYYDQLINYKRQFIYSIFILMGHFEFFDALKQ